MWGFEASALAFIQFPGTLASTRELIAEGGAGSETTDDSERVLSSHSWPAFCWLFWWFVVAKMRCLSAVSALSPTTVRVAVRPLAVLVNLVAAIVMASGRTVGLEGAVVTKTGV